MGHIVLGVVALASACCPEGTDRQAGSGSVFRLTELGGSYATKPRAHLAVLVFGFPAAVPGNKMEGEEKRP